MEISVETTSGLVRRMLVSIPFKHVNDEIDKILQQTVKKARIPGFRPGKIPISIIRQRYLPGIRQEALTNIVQQSFKEGIDEQKLSLAGAPTFDVQDIELGKDLKYAATFEVFPEFRVMDYENITLQRLNAKVTNADIEKMIEILRSKHASFVESSDSAEKRDKLEISYVIKVDNVVKETVNNSTLMLGSEAHPIPGFESGLIQAKVGNQISLPLRIPKDYANKDLIGKIADFTVTIHRIWKMVLPPLDEKFFNLFGVKNLDLTGFRLAIHENMDRELRQAVKTKIHNQIVTQLLDNNSVELPQILVSSEIESLREQLLKKIGKVNENQLEKLPKEVLEKQAKRRVRLGLIVKNMVTQLSLNLDKKRVDMMIKELSAVYDNPQRFIEYCYSSQEKLNEISSLVLEEQVVDFILEKAEIKEVSSSYEDAIRSVES